MEDIRLLLVDDDDGFLKLTKLCLMKINKNLKITTITSAIGALSLLKKQQFDVIVSDYQMPKMDGLKLLKNIKKLYHDIPFIIFTGRGREEVAVQALNLGASYYHHKAGQADTQFRELLNLIERAAFRKRTKDSLKEIQIQNKMQIKASPIPMALWEKNGKNFLLKNINDTAIEFTNRSEEELLEMTAMEFYNSNPIFFDLIQKCFSNKKAISQEVNFTDSITTESKWIRVQCNFISPQKILVTIVDLTSLKLKESVNQRLIDQQEAINELAIVLGETQDIKVVYRIIYTYSKRIVNAESFIVSSYDSKKKIFTAKFGIAEGNEMDVSKFPSIPLEEKGKGTQSRVIHTGEIYYPEDLEKDLSKVKTRYTFNEKGEIIEGPPKDQSRDIVKAAVYVPMKISGEIIGVLIFQNYVPRSFTEKDLDLLTTFANVSAIGIENARLIEDLKKSNVSFEKEKTKAQKLIDVQTHINQELHRREEHLQKIIDSSPVGIYIYDLDSKENLIFKGSNPAADYIMNFDHQKFVGKTIFKAFPALKDTVIPDEYLKVAKNGGVWEIDRMDYQDKFFSGSFEVRAFQYKPGSIVVMFSDITKRIIAQERELRRVHDLTFLSQSVKELVGLTSAQEIYHFIGLKMNEIVGDSYIAVHSYDALTNIFTVESLFGVDKKLKVISKILGKRPQKIPFKIQRDSMMTFRKRKLVPLEDNLMHITKGNISKKMSDSIIKMLKIKRAYTIALMDKERLLGGIIVAFRKNNDIRNIELIETFTHQISVALLRSKDIEERVQSDIRYSKLVDSMNDGFSIADLNGSMIYANDKLCEMLGYSREEIIGCKVSDFLDEKNKKINKEEHKKRNLGLTEPYQLYFTRKNGLQVPTLVKPNMQYDFDGNLSGIFAVITDISKIKQVEDRIRTKQIELQKQKDELESFSSTVSHDIKGRLQILMSLVEMGQSEYSEMIIDQIDDLYALLENLLLLAKKGEILGELSVVNLNELLEKIAKNISTADPDLKIIIRDLPKLKSDPTKLSQVFENILMNVLKHAKATKVEIFSEENKNEYIIHIRDNGIGITKMKQDEIRMSWKTRRYSSFGMLIALKIVEAHNGKMVLTSKKGQGTTVSVHFPKKKIKSEIK